MRVSRRDFLRASAALSGALALRAAGLSALQDAIAATGESTVPVIWLQGQGCTGCSVSFLNSVHYATADELLLQSLDVRFHPNVMAAAGDEAVAAADSARRAGGYVLVIEGAIPFGADGQYCHLWEGMTMVDAIRSFAPGAIAVLAVGTCATYAGIPGGRPNPTDALGVDEALERLGITAQTINIPGCPVHPDWLVGTVAKLLNGQAPQLDSYGRPLDYFPQKKIHDRCPLKGTEEANRLGLQSCLKKLGCRGPKTHADCDIRQWNSSGSGAYGVSWCIGAGSPCIGCVEPGFPDSMSPFYRDGEDFADGLPMTDQVQIAQARYYADGRRLHVEAESSGSEEAGLTLYGYGLMTFNGDSGLFEYIRDGAGDPGGFVTVLSSLGGSATAEVERVDEGAPPDDEPGDGETADEIRIVRAEYRHRTSQLSVDVVSSAGREAALTVLGYGPMAPVGRRHRYRQRGVANPGETVTVVSDRGGTAEAQVQHRR